MNTIFGLLGVYYVSGNSTHSFGASWRKFSDYNEAILKIKK